MQLRPTQRMGRSKSKTDALCFVNQKPKKPNARQKHRHTNALANLDFDPGAFLWEGANGFFHPCVLITILEIEFIVYFNLQHQQHQSHGAFRFTTFLAWNCFHSLHSHCVSSPCRTSYSLNARMHSGSSTQVDNAQGCHRWFNHYLSYRTQHGK